MQEFSRISFVYEAKVLPIGAGFGILSWLSCPVVIWTAYGPWAAGTLDTVSYLFDLYAAFVLCKAGKFHFCRPHQL